MGKEKEMRGGRSTGFQLEARDRKIAELSPVPLNEDEVAYLLEILFQELGDQRTVIKSLEHRIIDIEGRKG